MHENETLTVKKKFKKSANLRASEPRLELTFEALKPRP
jgi:hypothetical protein